MDGIEISLAKKMQFVRIGIRIGASVSKVLGNASRESEWRVERCKSKKDASANSQMGKWLVRHRHL